jgi:hypothetical protein
VFDEKKHVFFFFLKIAASIFLFISSSGHLPLRLAAAADKAIALAEESPLKEGSVGREKKKSARAPFMS